MVTAEELRDRIDKLTQEAEELLQEGNRDDARIYQEQVKILQKRLDDLTGAVLPPEPISQLPKKMDELSGGMAQLLSLLAPKRQMSTAGSQRAENVLQHFGLTEIDGHLNYKLDAVPSDFVSVAPFDMMQYPDEKLATIPFAIYLTGKLAGAGAVMAVKGGFSVLDLHASDGRLELTVDLEHGPVTFTGVIDVGVVPHGVMGACGHMLRIGIELKYTEAQKKARERQIEEQQRQKRKREADDSDVDMPDVLGLEYSAQPRAQVILQLIGAYSVVQHPLALYLTNGAVYHRVTLIGKEVVCWSELTPREAIHCVVQELDKAPTNVDYELDDTVAPNLAESVRYIHGAIGNSALAEQLETILPQIDTSAEKLATAMQLIQAHYPTQADSEVPSWLQQCLE